MKRIAGQYIFDPEITAGKMIFLTGPRQVGKTTFALNWLATKGVEGTYFNWDDPSVRNEYARNPLYFRNRIEDNYRGNPVPMVFDEIHKHRGWKNILKAIYDTNREKLQLLVTGSARLGLYRKSGDSLVGRYFAYQMHPLGLPEAVEDFSRVLKDDQILFKGTSLVKTLRKIDPASSRDALERLLRFGGFPEPFLKASPRFHRRWQEEYKTLMTKEEVRDLSRITDLKGIEHLVEILPAKVGSPLSINSLREDIGTHHSTLVNWLEILKELYLIFTIRPWHKNVQRSIRKEPKLFFFDWSILTDEGKRFENFLAVSLLRMADRFTETGLGNFEIGYVRDKEKREVDFILIKDNKPLALFEAKTADSEIGRAGKYFGNKLKIPFYQIVYHLGAPEEYPGDCWKLPAVPFLILVG
jgi:predicted AAA+ superfamily ATPase